MKQIPAFQLGAFQPNAFQGGEASTVSSRWISRISAPRTLTATQSAQVWNIAKAIHARIYADNIHARAQMWINRRSAA